MTNRNALGGKPYAGNPHMRFEEGEFASATPRRGTLLYKIGGLLTVYIALLVAPIAGAYYSDLAPRVGSQQEYEDERQERELRKLLIERLKQENESYDRAERIQSQQAEDHFSKQEILNKIKKMPWWGWGCVCGLVVFVLA